MKLNVVPAARGLEWVKLGMRTLLKQPLALAALVFMYSMIALAMLIVPLAGPFLMSAIVPVGTLGLMAATRVADQSAFPMPAILFTGLRAGRDRARAMFVLGALYALSLLVLVLVVALLVPIPGDVKSATELAQSPEFAISIIASSILYMPVSLAFWHAPALVHWHGVPPVKSLFFSFVACIRNIKAFTVYGMAWAGILAAIVAVSTLASIISPWLSGVLFGAASTFAVIAFYISIYFTFRDSFLEAEDNPGELQ
jgi:hypothetical protein